MVEGLSGNTHFKENEHKEINSKWAVYEDPNLQL